MFLFVGERVGGCFWLGGGRFGDGWGEVIGMWKGVRSDKSGDGVDRRRVG